MQEAMEPGQGPVSTQRPEATTSARNDRMRIECSSSHTLRAPVHEEFRPETGTHVLVIDGHNHQVVIEASRAWPRRRRDNAAPGQDDGFTATSETGRRNPVFQGAPREEESDGHQLQERSNGGAADEDSDTPPPLQIYARHADKFTMGPVILLRLSLTYSAAVMFFYFVIFGLNMLMKYSMTVLVPVLEDQRVAAAVLTVTCIPALCEFLAALIALSYGMALDLWSDLNWLENGSPGFVPLSVRHWTVLFLLLIAPMATFVVSGWIPPEGDSLTNCLLCVTVSLLTLFALYFLTVAAARVRLCMIVLDEGRGARANLLQVLNVSLLRRFSFAPLWLSRLCPGSYVAEGNEGRLVDGGASRATEDPEAASGGSSPEEGPEGGKGRFFEWSRAEPHACLEYNQATMACEQKTKMVNTACWGAFTVQEEWTAAAIKGDSRGVLTEVHANRMLTSCCLGGSDISAEKKEGADTGCVVISGASALIAVVVLVVMGLIGASFFDSDGYRQFAVAAIVVVAVAAIYLAVPVCRSLWGRLRLRRRANEASAEATDAANDLEMMPAAAAEALRSTEPGSPEAAGASSSSPPSAPISNTEGGRNPIQKIQDKMIQEISAGPGLPKRPVLVPVRWLMVVLYICKIGLLVVLPIVSFTVIASQTGLWYMNSIVIVACLYSGFANIFDLDETLRWAGPAGMLKLQSRGWRHGRAAHLLVHRMQPRFAVRAGFLFFAIMAAFIIFLSIGGTNQDPSTYQGIEFVYNATLPVNASSGQRYPLCNLPEPIPGISVLDYGMLADAAYVADQERVNVLVDDYFGPGTMYVYKNFSSTFYGSYYILNVRGTQDFIISIRGTSSLLDMITDANLWLEVVLVQIGRWLLPAGSFWDVVYPYIINSLNVDEGNEEFQYDDVIEEEVKFLLQVPGSRVVLTGHSLGGGVGAIVSARQQVPAVIFSGPNAVLSRLKFNVTQQQLNAWPINVIPGTDPVAHVDLPSQLAQRVSCLGSGMTCHHLDRTQCEIQSACGTGGRPVISPQLCGKYGYSYEVPAS